MEKNESIFVVEDDPDIRELLEDYLVQNGFDVTTCNGGAELDQKLAEFGEPSFIILDVMMPGEDGLSICRRLRATSGVPILMLTAKSEDIDRIIGLEIGADDYLPKPFNPRELLARIRAVLRRGVVPQNVGTRISFAGLIMDKDSRSINAPDGSPIELTAAEYDLLDCFVTRPGRVLSRDQLMDWTRGRQADVFDRTIDVQLSRLRKKIELDDTPLFKTIRGQGYILTATIEKA